MKNSTLYSKLIDFSQITDPIKTEETIFYQLREVDLGIPYAAVPLAYSINHLGIDKTQYIVDEVEKTYPGKKFYVCQHILVNKINFGENIVFTPHTVEKDKYFFIPHYNPLFQTREKYKKTSERGNDLSFMGDYNTNHLRKLIGDVLSSKIPVFSTGKWFFSHDENTQKDLRQKYKILLEDTKFPLCPQGTGPSTLRLFESLSSGGFPVIFNDIKIPIDIMKFCIKSNLEEIQNMNFSFHKSFNDDYQEELLDTYWSKYSNDNLSRSIVLALRSM